MNRSFFTNADKYKCITRELSLRRAVYPQQVRRGKMKQHAADREIELMEAIARDYAPVPASSEVEE